ncbi:hypothetical protein [Bacillus mycoides]|uniref:Uncharacterized protein n=1 Tax=Bacillus mycoides (strain KBAB4) TaxID=315730 RepID=A9VVI4_BACMK|nr:hypothetical protein [Bacillus mycoides]ABY46799.1 hypothetical protein BcerKBAB4_5305 [Bacillus mycoides KBAB4]
MRELSTSSKEWTDAREALLKEVRKLGLGITSIKNYTPDFILLEGSSLGLKYDFNSTSVSVWTKGRRSAGREYPLADLLQLGMVCRKWQMETQHRLGEKFA